MGYPVKRKAAPPYEDEDPAGAAAVDDGTGIGGDDYYPMGEADPALDPGLDAGLEADPADPLDAPADPGAEMKPGALALQEWHDHLLDLGDIVSRLSEMQENPEVQKHLDRAASELDRSLSGVQKLFGKLYPDYEPLAGGLDSGVDAAPDLDPDLDSEVEKGMGMSEGEGSDGGYTVDDTSSADDDDELAIKKRHAARKRLNKRLDLARTWRELSRAKRYGGDPAVAIRGAAEHLEELAASDDWSPIHKSACRYYAQQLSAIKAGRGEAPDPEALREEGRAEVRKAYAQRLDRLNVQLAAFKRNSHPARGAR